MIPMIGIRAVVGTASRIARTDRDDADFVGFGLLGQERAPIVPECVIRFHKPIIAIIALAALASACALVAFGLRQDYRLEAFVATDDDAYHRFRSFMQEFTSNEFAMIAVHSADVYGPKMDTVITALSSRVAGIDAVQRCSSLATLPAAARMLLGDRLLSHPMVAGTLISNDRRTVALLMQMKGESGAQDEGAHRRETVRTLRRIVADARRAHPQYQFMLAGPYVTLIDMYEYVDRDLRLFSVAAFVLTVAAMWLVFRRVLPMLYAGGVAAAAILVTLGVTVALGVVASLITQMLVILIIVLCVALCVHLAVAREETAARIGDQPWREAARGTLQRMTSPCVAVMATTAIGFGSVCISRIAPVRRFGGLMVLGLLIGLVAGLAGVALLHRARTARYAGHAVLAGRLERMARFAVRHRSAVFLVFAIATLLLTVGVRFLRFESDFVNNFRAGSEVRRSYRFIERNLSPLGSVEIIARRKDGKRVDTHAAVATAAAVVRDGLHESMVRKGLSLADALTLVPGGSTHTDRGVRARLALLTAVPGGPGLVRNFINDTRDALRINFRCVEGYDVDEKLAACEALRAHAAHVFGDDYAVEVTGLYYFYAGLVANLLRDQYRALAISTAAILLAFLAIFRNLRVTIIALVVNLLPVVCCLGAMGWAHIPVNMTSAMMLSAALGIAVDDTIHYIWRYRVELAVRSSVPDALAATQRSVGRACFFTSVVITAGFTILLFSQFLPTAYFGGLVGFTMVVALCADLLLLPALLSVLGEAATPTPAGGRNTVG